jgi:hypothetical protein
MAPVDFLKLLLGCALLATAYKTMARRWGFDDAVLFSDVMPTEGSDEAQRAQSNQGQGRRGP